MPAFFPLQSVPLSALELGLETEATAAVKQEPETVSTPALLNVRVRTGASGFCMCGGLIMAGCQVPAKLLYHSPSPTGWGEEKSRTKGCGSI